jgi:hypothetical protein
VRRITTAAIERKLSLMRDTPAAANNLRKVLAGCVAAIKLGWRQDNPVDATDNSHRQSFHPWSEAEIDALMRAGPSVLICAET